MSAVLETSTPLTSAETLVLLVLANFADDEGRRCWPSQATIGRMARTTPKGVRGITSRLVQKGIISIVEPAVGTRSARYVIHVEALATPHPGSGLEGNGSAGYVALQETPAIARGERGGTLEGNAADARGERGFPDPLDPPSDPPEEQPASPADTHDDDDATPFRCYAAIAKEAVRITRSDNIAEISETFQRMCARQGKRYNSSLATRAIDAAQAGLRAQRAAVLDTARRRSAVG